MDHFEQEVLTMQGVLQEELSQRNLVVDDRENEIRTLYRNLIKGLSSIRRDLANEFGDIRKNFALQGYKVDVLTGLINGIARDFVKPNEVIEQQAREPTRSNDAESDVTSGFKATIESSFVTQEVDIAATAKISAYGNNDIATFELNPSSDVVSLTNRSKQDGDKVDESSPNGLEASNKSIWMKNEDVGRVHEQIASLQSEIRYLSSVVATKNVEVGYQKGILELAEKRLVQMKRMENEVIGSVEQFTQLIADGKVNENNQMEDLHTVVESLQTTVSSWMTVMDRFKDVSIDTQSTSEESVVMNIELPDHLKRLQQLYARMTEKLTAASVAAELFQNDVLSLKELQKVRNPCNTPVEAAEYLLNRILDMRSEVRYDCFLSALKATNQEHIFLWLTYDDYNIDSQHTELIRRNYSFLLHHLDPKDS